MALRRSPSQAGASAQLPSHCGWIFKPAQRHSIRLLEVVRCKCGLPHNLRDDPMLREAGFHLTSKVRCILVDIRMILVLAEQRWIHLQIKSLLLRNRDFTLQCLRTRHSGLRTS